MSFLILLLVILAQCKKVKKQKTINFNPYDISMFFRSTYVYANNWCYYKFESSFECSKNKNDISYLSINLKGMSNLEKSIKDMYSTIKNSKKKLNNDRIGLFIHNVKANDHNKTGEIQAPALFYGIIDKLIEKNEFAGRVVDLYIEYEPASDYILELSDDDRHIIKQKDKILKELQACFKYLCNYSFNYIHIANKNWILDDKKVLCYTYKMTDSVIFSDNFENDSPLYSSIIKSKK